MQLDLNDLNSVKAFADKVNGDDRFDKIDILLNNAGIGGYHIRKETAWNFEKI
jgi:NAD(P)-dependent dehydrogenase (short-subunit alcohol dehydrogenase family)